MDLNELHQREIDSLRDENVELRKKVKELFNGFCIISDLNN